ncbi:hypothetical protein REPUB_Repub11eG0061800 [Reevesia pubescens]
MSTTLAQPSCKKPSGCQNINHLPDAILHHILTFLPTKEAVATSILWNRRKYLWTQVPVLDFQQPQSSKTDVKQRTGFIQFVNKTLMFNRVGSVDKFRLSCDPYTSFINTWIGCVIYNYIVREVDISISATQKSQFLKLPSRFYTIKNLKVLKLSNGILIDIHNSMSVCFPSLKILHLKLVQYANNEAFSKLLCGCTVLEEFVVNRCPNDNVRNFSISIPTLKILDINQQLSKNNWFELVGRRSEVKINAPNLEFLKIIDVGSLVHLESVFISFIKAHICFNGTALFQLAKALCNAKFLSLKWIDSRASVMDNSFPLFLNLTQLELTLGNYCWDVIPYILENSHNLEVLVLNKVN